MKFGIRLIIKNELMHANSYGEPQSLRAGYGAVFVKSDAAGNVLPPIGSSWLIMGEAGDDLGLQGFGKLKVVDIINTLRDGIVSQTVIVEQNQRIYYDGFFSRSYSGEMRAGDFQEYTKKIGDHFEQYIAAPLKAIGFKREYFVWHEQK